MVRSQGAGVVGTGIELIDPGPTAIPTGALDPYDATSGRNVAVVTFDAIVRAIFNHFRSTPTRRPCLTLQIAKAVLISRSQT